MATETRRISYTFRQAAGFVRIVATCTDRRSLVSITRSAKAAVEAAGGGPARLEALAVKLVTPPPTERPSADVIPFPMRRSA